MSYYLQAITLGLFAALIFRSNQRRSIFPQIVTGTWIVGVSAIYWRYGPVGQWSFYQNDQYFHWKVVEQFLASDFNLTFDRMNFLRVPFTGPAFALAQVGFDTTLSLKFVSLCCALGSINLVEGFLARRQVRLSLIRFWMIAGPITMFFSLLALRETMMILCVSYLFLGTSQSGKVLSILSLVILRPHLAAAILFGQIWGWLFSRLRSNLYFPSIFASAILPIFIGTIGFSIGNYIIYDSPLRLHQSLFLKEQVIQIFSAFVGLQFFTVANQTVEYTTQSLLLIRLIFPEIVLVPFAFTISCFFFVPRLTRLKISVLATFVFFMSVSSGTEYLSVRQSLPMMPIMGVVAILTFVQPKFSKIQTRVENLPTASTAQSRE